MCDPVTITVIGLAAGVAGAGLKAVATARQVNAQNNAADYNASILRHNAAVQDMRAQDATERGKIAEQKQRIVNRQRIGKARAATAASGVSVNSGSTLDVLGDTTFFGENDALEIRRNAALESTALRQRGQDFRSQANLSTFGKRSPTMAVAGSLLNSTSSLANQFSAARGAGAFG